MESQGYEFTSTQDRLISELSNKMRFVSYVLIVIGALLIFAGLVSINQGGFGSVIYGIVQLLVGVWTNKAAASFRKIADTQGSDISNLMDALAELRKLYTLQYWLFILALVFIVIGLVTAIIYNLSPGG